MAYNLAEEGKYFDTLTIFNQYKLGKFEDEPASDDKPISAKDLIKEMQEDKTYTVTLKGFRDNVIKHKTEIMESIVYRIPEIKMFLGIERGKVKILAEFDSIFDICWYTIIRLLSVNGELADEDLEGVLATRFNEVHYGVCSCCRNLFKINSNRQRYCHSELCQQERNRKKIREYRRRKTEGK